MRRRGFRVFLLMAVIVGLSIATLSFREIHISFLGANLDRDSSGPLGLTLGLDLQGGSHLVYQADVPVDVTYQDSVDESQIRDVLTELGHIDATIETPETREFAIRQLSLREVGETSLRTGLEESLAPVTSFELTNDVLELVFSESQEEAQLVSVLNDLRYTDATVEVLGQGRFTVTGLDPEGVAVTDLQASLERELGGIDTFNTSDGVVDVASLIRFDSSDIRALLIELGYTGAIVSQEYEIRGIVLKEEQQSELELALAGVGALDSFNPGEVVTPDNMEVVQNIIERRVNALGTTEPIIQTLGSDRIVVQLPGVGGSSVDIIFLPPPNAEFISVLLQSMERSGDTVEQTGLETFTITSIEPVTGVDRHQIRDSLTDGLGPVVSLESATGDDREMALVVPLAPDEGALSGLMTGLGFTKFSVQRQESPNEFIIRTEKALGTEDQERLRDALGEQLARVLAFSARGGIEEAKALIRGTAQLVFKQRICNASSEQIFSANDLGLPDPCGEEGTYVDRDIGLTGEFLSRAFAGRDPVVTARHQVHVEFNSTGTSIFRDLTETLFDMGPKGRIAMFLDDQLISAPTVTTPIRDGRGVITGGFTRQSARDLAIQLESGRLPIPLALIRESTVDALLGSDSLRKSLTAGLVGLGLVLLFVVIYYRMAGVVAAIALLIYAVIVLAILKLLPGTTITLSGIAGLVLSVGFAVDANILIFERMKEEMRTGRSLTSAMEVGFRRAWVAIRDSNFSTILTCAILFLFGSRLGGGTPVVTGFAITLLIGVCVSMFTAMTVSRNMLQILALTPAGRNTSLFSPEPQRQPVGVAGGGK